MLEYHKEQNSNLELQKLFEILVNALNLYHFNVTKLESIFVQSLQIFSEMVDSFRNFELFTQTQFPHELLYKNY